MEISVIVPTLKRAASVDALLRDLARQRGDVLFEVLVVDNGSQDDTARVVRRHAARDARIRYVLETRPGASCARNAGIARAAAPIVAFIDDDVRPRHDWVASIAAAFAAHPDIDCIGGRVEPRWPCAPPRWLTRALWAPLALQVERAGSRVIDRDHASACLITANFACRAGVFQDVGGFAPEYRRDEDRELNLRMWRAGKRGLYIDSVVAFAEIQRERLTKPYHRAWYRVTGASHARLHYRDSIDRDGRIDDGLAARGRIFMGVPGFLYRDIAVHAAQWIARVVRDGWNSAFYEECRLQYLASYVATRWRERLAAAPARARVSGMRSS